MPLLLSVFRSRPDGLPSLPRLSTPLALFIIRGLAGFFATPGSVYFSLGGFMSWQRANIYSLIAEVWIGNCVSATD